jgi:hypothetical protein
MLRNLIHRLLCVHEWTAYTYRRTGRTRMLRRCWKCGARKEV